MKPRNREASRQGGARCFASGKFAFRLWAVLCLAMLAPVTAFAFGATSEIGAVGSPNTSNIAPSIFEKVGFEQKLDAQVPAELGFWDESGKAVRLGDYFADGKPTLLTLVYYGCPNLCNLSIKGLLKSLKKNALALGVDYKTILVSIDPSEKPKYAGEQKERFLKAEPVGNADKGLHFLTGEEANIRELARRVGFGYQYDPKTRQYAHAAGIMVLTPQGRISHYLFGIEYPEKDLRLSLVEASGSRIGTAVDQFLLFCYHYDPAQGKYGLFILNLVRGFAALLVVLGGGAIFLMTRSHRRKVLQVS